MIECKKKIFLETMLSRFDLKAWISFSLNIVKYVIQLICYSGFSLKIQAITADVFDQM